MPLTGDDAKLERLVKKLREASKVAFLKQAFGSELASAATDLYQKSFRSQTAPLGDRWPASPHGMVLTGALSNPTTEFKGTQLIVDAGSYTSTFHQAGWRKGVQKTRIHVRTDILAVDIVTKKVSKVRNRFKTVREGGTQAGPPRPVLPTRNDAGTWERPLKSIIERGVTEFFSSF